MEVLRALWKESGSQGPPQRAWRGTGCTWPSTGRSWAAHGCPMGCTNMTQHGITEASTESKKAMEMGELLVPGRSSSDAGTASLLARQRQHHPSGLHRARFDKSQSFIFTKLLFLSSSCNPIKYQSGQTVRTQLDTGGGDKPHGTGRVCWLGCGSRHGAPTSRGIVKSQLYPSYICIYI